MSKIFRLFLINHNRKPSSFCLLECTSHDPNVTQNEHAIAAEILNEILDDLFLFVLHFHFDIHEYASGELKILFLISSLKMSNHLAHRRTHEDDATR